MAESVVNEVVNNTRVYRGKLENKRDPQAVHRPAAHQGGKPKQGRPAQFRHPGTSLPLPRGTMRRIRRLRQDHRLTVLSSPLEFPSGRTFLIRSLLLPPLPWSKYLGRHSLRWSPMIRILPRPSTGVSWLLLHGLVVDQIHHPKGEKLAAPHRRGRSNRQHLPVRQLRGSRTHPHLFEEFWQHHHHDEATPFSSVPTSPSERHQRTWRLFRSATGARSRSRWLPPPPVPRVPMPRRSRRSSPDLNRTGPPGPLSASARLKNKKKHTNTIDYCNNNIDVYSKLCQSLTSEILLGLDKGYLGDIGAHR